MPNDPAPITPTLGSPPFPATPLWYYQLRPMPIRRSALFVAVASALTGCGSTGATTNSNRTPTAPASHGQTTPPAQTAAPASHGQTVAPPPGRGVPQPTGPANLTVTPSTVSPGSAIVVTLRAPPGTRQAVVTLAATGGTVTARATPAGGGFTARLVVPRGVAGGFWPVVARYGAATLTRSATAQVKVFTP